MQLVRLRPSATLMLGQALALGVSFIVPMVLARQLTIEDFGTYRLIMMLQVLFTIVGSIGFDGGLFRHVRSESVAPVFQANLSFIWGLACGCIVACFVWFFGAELGALLNAPDITYYSAPLAILILVAMPTAHLEHFCIAIDRPGLSAVVVVLHACGCAVATVTAVLTVGTISAVLYSLIIWFSVRFLAVGSIYVAKISALHIPLNIWWIKGLNRLRSGLPIGGNNLILAIGRFDRFLVSALFGVAGFARYSVGCMEIPLARHWIETSQNLSSVKAVDRSLHMSLQMNLKHWMKDCLRISAILLPVIVLAMIFAPNLLKLVFGQNYANSSDIFRLFLVGVLLSAFDPELFLRATEKASISAFANLIAMGIFAAIAYVFYKTASLSLEGLMGLRVGVEVLNTAAKYVVLLYLPKKKNPPQTSSEGASMVLA
jgi:O-antigen/teichoic acid export membrane protein